MRVVTCVYGDLCAAYESCGALSFGKIVTWKSGLYYFREQRERVWCVCVLRVKGKVTQIHDNINVLDTH